MIYQGIAISPGVAVAPVCRYIPAQRTVTQQRAEDAAQELQASEAALAAAAAARGTAYETMPAATPPPGQSSASIRSTQTSSQVWAMSGCASAPPICGT